MSKPTDRQIEAGENQRPMTWDELVAEIKRLKAEIERLTAAMTKSTEAQIEAVEDVLRGLVVITGDSTWDMNYVARKVLTAAEVGVTVERAEILTRQEQNAIIERCAQVADNMAYVESCADDTMRGVTNGDPYRKVAAAIRELKDKP